MNVYPLFLALVPRVLDMGLCFYPIQSNPSFPFLRAIRSMDSVDIQWIVYQSLIATKSCLSAHTSSLKCEISEKKTKSNTDTGLAEILTDIYLSLDAIGG
jgi:hypothetical protein